jgi:hypothetical protein
MRGLAAQDKAMIADCSGLRWIDVDDGTALDKAETWLEFNRQASRGKFQRSAAL